MKNFLLTLLLIPLASIGQKQGNIWYFGEHAGLDFSTGVPIPISGGQIYSSLTNTEGSSVICDSSGSLLFYATPIEIYNRNHSAMPNGSFLMGGLSSTQGVLIIPQPGSNELFYVFTLDQFQNNLQNGLRYSKVDMCLDNGMGDVISGVKNILLLDSTGEKMTATFHSNGIDVWLVTRKHFTNEFYAYLITANGISAPVISPIGWDNPSHGVPNALGQMKISPDGSKIAFGVGNQIPTVIQLFDFDNTTGIVSHLIDFPTVNNSGYPYGIAFSPDNSKLYVRGPQPTGLDQYDLSSGIAAVIISSLYNVPWTGPYGGTGLQLANNGKIYVDQTPNIGVINYPNLQGIACDFVGNAILSNASYTFPGFIDNFNYNNGIPNCLPVANFTVANFICPGTCTDFQNLSSNILSCQWDFPGGIPSSSTDINPSGICYANPGTYDATLIVTNSVSTDTLTLINCITVYPQPSLQSITQSGDTLYALPGASSYQWYFNGSILSGATDYFYVALSSGDYNVICSDSNGCEVEAVIYNVNVFIDLIHIENYLLIYPNPSNGRITIDSPVNLTSLEIYDLMGSKILSNHFSIYQKKYDFRTDDLMDGIYFIKVFFENGSTLRKFIVSGEK